MYCLLSHCNISPGSQDEMARIFRDEIEPLLSNQPGVQGVCCLVKLDGEALVLSVWDSKEQADAWPEKNYHEKILARLASIDAEALTSDRYEMLAMRLFRSIPTRTLKAESPFVQYFRFFTGKAPDELYGLSQELCYKLDKNVLK